MTAIQEAENLLPSLTAAKKRCSCNGSRVTSATPFPA